MNNTAGTHGLVGIVMMAVVVGLPGAAAGQVRGAGAAMPDGPVPAVKVVDGDFRLELRYFGEAEKPYYNLTLLYPTAHWAGPKAADPFHTTVHFHTGQAPALMGYLGETGFLGKANEREIGVEAKWPRPEGPFYRISAGPFRVVVRKETVRRLQCEEELWGLDLLVWLDGLRKVLADGDRTGWKQRESGGALCPKCGAKELPAAVGKCTACGGKTSSVALTLCDKCSGKSGKCAGCGVAATREATAAMDRLIGRLAGHRRQWLAAGDGSAVGSPKHIAALIAQLGEDSYKVRDAATAKLIALGERVVREALEAKAVQPGLDPEVASRIEKVLSVFDVQQGRRVTHRATGLALSLSDDGRTITAAVRGKIVWKLKTSQEATSLRLEKDTLLTLPHRRRIDVKTGEIIGLESTDRNGGPVRRL